MDDATRIEAMGAKWDKAVIETDEWAKSLQLERPCGTAFHRALDAWKANEFLYYPTVEPAKAAAYHDGLMSRSYQVFLVEHDIVGGVLAYNNYEVSISASWCRRPRTLRQHEPRRWLSSASRA